MKVSRRHFIATTCLATLATATLPSWAQAPKMISIALVGVAHLHTPGYLEILKKRSDVRVKYVWDHDSERASRRAKEMSAEAVTDLTTIWADPEIIAVIILSETNRHNDLVLAAAHAGKHLFVEKPLGVTGTESLAMASAIESAKLLFTTGYFSRTDPKILFLKKEIAAGNFGQITRVRASNCHNGSLQGWFDGEWRWITDEKLSGVGAFGDLGTHKLDILMWLFGEVEAVTADIKPVTHRYGECDESGEALLHFKNGITGTLAAGWVDLEDPVKLQISGTEGHAVIYNDQLFYRSEKIETSDNRKPLKNLPPALPEPLPQFLSAVAGGSAATLVTPHEAATRVVVMEKMYQASRERKWCAVA
jgi:predicted dehydrogenase